LSEPLSRDVVRKSPSARAGVYPPSFCNWKPLLTVVLITQLSVLLVGIGRGQLFDGRWFLVTTMYAQWMALFCASGVCFLSSWTHRFGPNGAWVGNAVVVMLLAAVFSHAAWLLSGDFGLRGTGSSSTFVLSTLLAVGLVTVVFFRYLLIRTRWKAQLIAESEARVQALQARIRPHFLFNSLNTIASLIPVDPDSAEAATEDLADIFRGSMRRADKLISLEEELRLAQQYLDMERRRLGERLSVVWRAEELPSGAAVLPLMLQPLLENAVGHGVQPRPSGGEITVYGRAEGDNIVITIGNPIAPAGADKPGHGLALANIRERLKLAFGNRANLITNRDSERFYAVLSFPYVEHTDY
jgi:two-component system sensor histidine kinase AlgZ